MTFSERYGYKPVRDALQFECMDAALHTRLWNALRAFLDRAHGYDQRVLPALWGDHWKRAADDLLSWNLDLALPQVKEVFFKLVWFEVYDLIQFVAQLPAFRPYADDFVAACNGVMKDEGAGYRFLGKHIVPITSEEELQAIEEGLEAARPLHGVHTQLEAALAKLSERPEPDYRNSVKESISAVESLGKVITRDDSASLGEALPKIESALGLKLHPALRGALHKLYGWTSNEGGIRHGMVDEPNVGLAEAKFMLVACSAFVNYLLAKCADAGIDLSRD
jgi:hypothetical protein